MYNFSYISRGIIKSVHILREIISNISDIQANDRIEIIDENCHTSEIYYFYFSTLNIR